MANRKTAPAPVTGENLGPMSAETHTELASLSHEAQNEIALIDAMCGDGEEYARANEVAKGKVGAQLYQQGGLMLGKSLLRIKAHEERGQFHHIVEVNFGMEVRTAQRLMQMTRGMLNADGSFKLSDVGGKPLASLSTSKLLELSTLSDDDFAELEAGGSVGDVTKDRLPLMTTRELREALAARDAMIDQKDAKKDEYLVELEAADKEIRRLKRGGKDVEESNFAEILDDCTTAFDEQFKVAEKMIGNLADTMAVLDETVVPAHMHDIAKRSLVMGSHARILQLGEIVARLIDRHEITFSRFHADSKFLLPDADGAMS